MKVFNPLDKFKSHSVHYVVLAAASTEALRSFTEGSSASAPAISLAAINAARALGDEVRIPGAGDSAYLVMDTRRFSQFTIESFDIETYVGGFTVPGSETPHSTSINMSFTVIDSVGVSFANFLQYIMDQKLQVSFDGMVLLVRVLFVGHSDSVGGVGSLPLSQQETVQSISIPCIFHTIEMQLTETRGVYNCKLYPLIGMTSNLNNNSKWTNIGNATTYFTGPGANTLGAMVDSFERNLNAELTKRFQQLNAITQQPGQRNKETNGRFGRPVQYMITIPKTWENYTFSGPAVGAASEIDFRQLIAEENATRAQQRPANDNKTAPAQDSHISVPPDWTVTEVLDKIFSQTVDVAKLANFNKSQPTDQSIKFYKHLITVTSDEQSILVHIDVVEYEVPNVYLSKNSPKVAQNDDQLFQIDPQTGNRVPKNFIEYDYIFSGKNLDVLAFDIKIENLNYLLMEGTKLGAGETAKAAIAGDDQKNGESEAQETKSVGAMRPRDPVLMPSATAQQRTNFSNYAAGARTQGDLTPQELSQEYMRNLSAFYNAAPYTAKMELRGNPDLLTGVVLQRIPQHKRAVTVAPDGSISETNRSVKSEYRRELDETLGLVGGVYRPNGPISGKSYVTTPVFAKINIYGPNVNFLTNAQIPITGSNGQNFAQRLFIDNYYYLSKIVSKIQGSKFTHDIDLMTYSVFGAENLTARGVQTGSTAKEVR